MTGRIGDDLSAEDGYRAARLVGLAMLASLKRELGELDRVAGGYAPSATSTPRTTSPAMHSSSTASAT